MKQQQRKGAASAALGARGDRRLAPRASTNGNDSARLSVPAEVPPENGPFGLGSVDNANGFDALSCPPSSRPRNRLDRIRERLLKALASEPAPKTTRRKGTK